VPHPCLVCCHPKRQAIDALIATGASDYEVGRQFGIERVSVGRHRRQHIIKPAQDRLAILAKDADARRERQELATAAASDTPSTQALVEATLGLRRQMAKLDAIEQRLERMAQASEQAGSPVGVSQLSSQQLRAIETGAKLGGIGGFKPPSIVSPMAERATVSIEIIFPNSGKREEIALADRPLIDGDKVDPVVNDGAALPAPHPNQKLRRDVEGKAGAYWDFGTLPDKPADDNGDDAG
jgi:hypothetical protein